MIWILNFHNFSLAFSQKFDSYFDWLIRFYLSVCFNKDCRMSFQLNNRWITIDTRLKSASNHEYVVFEEGFTKAFPSISLIHFQVKDEADFTWFPQFIHVSKRIWFNWFPKCAINSALRLWSRWNNRNRHCLFSNRWRNWNSVFFTGPLLDWESQGLSCCHQKVL